MNESGDKMQSDIEGRKRWKQMKLRYTKAEYDEIKQAAANAQETLSNYYLSLVRAAASKASKEVNKLE
jgi:uncharacterized protein (DUF1778 family)